MNTFAAVITGQQPGAISTIQIFGPKAVDIIKSIFQTSQNQASFKTGQILLGTIQSCNKIIDQVTIGAEGENLLAIHCHGNPLIVADIMTLLIKAGAEAISKQKMVSQIMSQAKTSDSIAIETKITLAKAKNIAGTKIILSQTQTGLKQQVIRWLKMIEAGDLAGVNKQAKIIIESSKIANVIINGCRVILIGPPNSGKSTLLNRLVGQQKAIVTDIKGTTRDHINCWCKYKSLNIELVDTAGLDKQLSTHHIDKISQAKTIRLIEKSNLVLVILDADNIDMIDQLPLKKFKTKNVIVILNKSDLGRKLNRHEIGELTSKLGEPIEISAKFNTNIDAVLQAIYDKFPIDKFNVKTSVCFTRRQLDLVRQLITISDREIAQQLTTELLKGPICV